VKALRELRPGADDVEASERLEADPRAAPAGLSADPLASTPNVTMAASRIAPRPVESQGWRRM
jgi:hypothetical protein